MSINNSILKLLNREDENLILSFNIFFIALLIFDFGVYLLYHIVVVVFRGRK